MVPPIPYFAHPDYCYSQVSERPLPPRAVLHGDIYEKNPGRAFYRKYDAEGSGDDRLSFPPDRRAADLCRDFSYPDFTDPCCNLDSDSGCSLREIRQRGCGTVLVGYGRMGNDTVQLPSSQRGAQRNTCEGRVGMPRAASERQPTSVLTSDTRPNPSANRAARLRRVAPLVTLRPAKTAQQHQACQTHLHNRTSPISAARTDGEKPVNGRYPTGIVVDLKG